MLRQIVFCFLLTFSSCASKDKNYGPFNLLINSFVVCSGPKAKDCAALKVKLIGDAIIQLDLHVLKSCAPTKGKIVTSSNNKELTRFQMNKPCEHIFLRPLLASLYNITKNCAILKGFYSQRIDIGQIANNYFGGSFFYGNFTFRAQLYNDDCNLSCTTLQVTMRPK